MLIFIFSIILIFINLLNYFLFELLTTKPTINHYKVRNIILCKAIVILGLLGVGAGIISMLFALLFSNASLSINLKDFYDIIRFIFNLLVHIPFGKALCLMILVISVISFFLLVFITSYKYYMLICFKLYIYYYHFCYRCQRTEYQIPFKWLYDKLERLGHRDLFSYGIYLSSTNFMGLLYGKNLNLRKLSQYHPYFILNYAGGYSFFAAISPLFFIIYDCIFHNFIIIHVFYYLLFYMPIMLLSHATNCLFKTSGPVCRMFWMIYYSEENLLLAISPNYKVILDSYLASGLSRNLSLDFDMEFSLPNMIQFIPYHKKNTFMNDFGTVLQLLENNKVFEEIEDEEGNIRLGDEWILLKYKKRNYKEFNKQNTLHKT